MAKFFIPVILISAVAFAAQKDGDKTKKKYHPTKHEQDIIDQARKEFSKAKDAPPPSKHMLDKMQSGLSD